jgi:hypothetical protein
VVIKQHAFGWYPYPEQPAVAMFEAVRATTCTDALQVVALSTPD